MLRRKKRNDVVGRLWLWWPKKSVALQRCCGLSARPDSRK